MPRFDISTRLGTALINSAECRALETASTCGVLVVVNSCGCSP